MFSSSFQTDRQRQTVLNKIKLLLDKLFRVYTDCNCLHPLVALLPGKTSIQSLEIKYTTK